LPKGVQTTVTGSATSSQRMEPTIDLMACHLRSLRRYTARRRDGQPSREPLRIVRCMDLRVVVEVDVDVPRGTASPLPAAEELRPAIELVVGVAADVELPRAVQPHVNEVGGELLGVRELPGGIS